VRGVPGAGASAATSGEPGAADYYPQGPETFQAGGRLSVGYSLAEELSSWN